MCKYLIILMDQETIFNKATLKKNFCFRSSGCPFLKPVGRPHFLFFFLNFFFGRNILSIFLFFYFFCKNEKKVAIRTFINHPAATPETEVFFSMA